MYSLTFFFTFRLISSSKQMHIDLLSKLMSDALSLKKKETERSDNVKYALSLYDRIFKEE